MKLSVVTVSFNQGSFLPEAVESVLGQADAEVEYIVVDAGSTDSSRNYLLANEGRFAQLLLEPDDGPADGLNKGFERATGDVYYFLNADDLMLPNAARRALQIFAEKKDRDILIGDGVFIGPRGDEIGKVRSVYCGVRPYSQGIGVVLQQGMFFRSETFKACGGFNARNRSCWDAELLMRLSACGGRVVVDHFPYGAFRIHQDSITGSGSHSLVHERERSELAREFSGGRETVLYRSRYVLSKCIGLYGRVASSLSLSGS